MGAVQLHLHQSAPPDLLVAVTDGLGLRDEFEYASLADTRVHRTGTFAIFPTRDLAGRSHVVSRRIEANGLRQETYFYEGATVHVQGRGLLGFARRTVTPDDASPVQVEEYLQDPGAYAVVGAPWRHTLRQRSGAPLQRTTYAWGRYAYGSGYQSRSFGYPSSVTVEHFELDGVLVTSEVTANVAGEGACQNQ